MIAIGSYNQLELVRKVDFGVYLSDGEQDILLPIRQVPLRAKQGDLLNVFVYTDSEDRPIATMLRPKAVVGDFAMLKVLSINAFGAFVDWGLEKDLLVPHSEQRYPLKEERGYVVRVLLDKLSNRVIGSTKLSKFLATDTSSLKEGQKVEAMFTQHTDDGTMAVIDNMYPAAIFPDEIFNTLRIGERRPAYIKRIREDGRVCLSLSPQGYEAVAAEAPTLLSMLKKNGGFLPYSDSTPPETIRAVFGMSKGSFKKLIGGLMKEGKIEISFHGIRLKD
jgi:predicted RNA-binding protein (virulence factor B family)